MARGRKAARNTSSHHSNAINFTLRSTLAGDVDFSDDLIILGDPLSGSKGSHRSQSAAFATRPARVRE